jgi:hypothetical protein
MAIPAYSVRLYSGTIDTASFGHPAFKVPAGQRAVVRFVSASGAVAAGLALFMYADPSHAELGRFYMAEGLGWMRTDCRLVVHEGETCTVRAIVGNLAVALHGYLLSGSGGPLVPPAAAGQLPVNPPVVIPP